MLPGLKHADVFKDGVNTETLNRALMMSIADFANFCVRNPSVCHTGENVAANVLEQAKTRFITAYHGVRTQFDEPDRDTTTAGIAKK